MFNANRCAAVLLCSAIFGYLGRSGAPAAEPTPEVAPRKPLVTIDERFDLSAVQTSDAQVAREGDTLVVSTGRSAAWPGITLLAPGGHWDLSGFGQVAVDVKNLGTTPVRVHLRVDNPGADGTDRCLSGNLEVAPGEQRTLAVALRSMMPPAVLGELFGMRGYPSGWVERGGIDPANVVQVIVFVAKPAAEHRFALSDFRAAGRVPNPAPSDPDKLFPLIDRYGQFVHADWPGKVHSDDDLAERRREEEADLAARPAPADWNAYGGWAGGPRLEATGMFRVEKHGGKWWLVDPEGRLFWSHGVDCVRSTTGATPITNRQHLFAWLPPREGEVAFYGEASWAPHGYYHGRGRYETFNFYGANLRRKYGDAWEQHFAELAHRRLRAWAMNTVANWSDPAICAMRRTPYTATIGFQSRPIEGSSGYWGKFPDPFDPSLAESLARAMQAERDRSAGDPWCIGYFVGNELSWGDDVSLAVAALASPSDQPAKRAAVELLRKKYGEIERLNQAWGAGHASWEALLAADTSPDMKKARPDLEAIYSAIAEEFFRVCREAVKTVAPKNLYLGCRFAWVNPRAVRASAKYCDVISFNKYTRSLVDLRLPEGIDRPVVIGEFHFGALDRGMFHPGLVPTEDQHHRAAAYRNYVESALDHPLVVGTHWFQFADQATTGRGDGENYQIGLVDVCDTPYPETIEAVRAVGTGMYARRAAAAP